LSFFRGTISIKRIKRLEKKKATILSVAREVLIKQGKNTSMGDIADALGMDTSSLYYYYKGIPEIINNLLDNEYHDFSSIHQNLKEEGKSSLCIIEEMVKLILEFYYDNLEIMQIILTQISPLFLDPEYREASVAINNYLEGYRTTNENLLEEIKLAQEEGEITSRFTPELILSAIRGIIFGICTAWREEKPPREMISDITERIFEMFG